MRPAKLLVVLMALIAPVVCRAGLVGYWTFDNTLADSSGNGHNATGNPVYDSDVPAAIGSGMSVYFDGTTTNRLDVPSLHHYFEGKDAFSFAAWVKADSIPQERGFFRGEGSHRDQDRWGIRYDKKGGMGGAQQTIKIGLAINGVTNKYQYEAAEYTQSDDWQHVAFVWRSGEGPQLYLDGDLDTPSANTIGTLVGTLSNQPYFYIGDGAKNPWLGHMDDVAVWDRALKPAEVAQLAAGTPPSELVPIPPEPILRVDLNGDSGPDQSGFSSWPFATREFPGGLDESRTFDFAGGVGGSVLVNLSTTTAAVSRNYGIDEVTDPGNLTIPDVWRDQVFFNNNINGTMTLTFQGLMAGRYKFTSYSYADNLADWANTNDEGTASVFIDTGAGFVDTLEDVTFISGLYSTVAGTIEAADLDAFGTLSLEFTVPNDGDTVRILFGDLTGGDTFGLNGFELEPLAPYVIPEPGTCLLLGGGLLMFLRRRRTRK